MNEIFTQPTSNYKDALEINDAGKKSKWKEVTLKNKYWPATFILLLTLGNDFFTYKAGFEKYGVGRTIGHYLAMTITIIIVAFLTNKCQKITGRILQRYNSFRTNEFKL